MGRMYGAWIANRNPGGSSFGCSSTGTGEENWYLAWRYSEREDRILLAGSLVHPDIIHQHSLREDCGSVWISRPVASHRQIEYQGKRVIEYPFPAGTKIRSGASDVELAVDIEANGIPFPLERENMKIVGKPPFFGQDVGRFDSNLSRVTRSMNRAVYSRRFFSNVFHDVDLATGGPTGFLDVVA